MLNSELANSDTEECGGMVPGGELGGEGAAGGQVAAEVGEVHSIQDRRVVPGHQLQVHEAAGTPRANR